MTDPLNKRGVSATMERTPEAADFRRMSREELVQLERQMIALLKTVRQLLGKRALIVPGENRAHG